MANKKMSESLSFRIGVGISNILSAVIGFILKLLWSGIVKAPIKFKPLFFLYGGFVAAALLSYHYFNSYYETILEIILIVVIGFGIYIKATEYPNQKRKAYFEQLFREIHLESKEKKVPVYLYEKQISEFALLLAFGTTVPLTEWYKMEDLLELHMNVKIIKMVQDKTDKRIINLLIQTNPLPEYIEWQDEFLCQETNTLNIGVSYQGMIGLNLEKYPHAFIAGETGSGKSNVLKCLIHQALHKDYEVTLIDFKRGVSFSSFSDAVAIYYEYKTVMEVLKEMVAETNRRLDLFRESRVDNINDYNKKGNPFLCRRVVFIDELAELLKTRDKELSNIINDSIETLTRLSRATGIHLIMGIQRPDSTIVNGQIKNNVSYRICGRFVDKEPSRIMLGSDIASTMPNIKGRFIVKDDDFQETQSFYFVEKSYITNEPTEQENASIVESSDIEVSPIQEKTEKGKNTQTKDIQFDFSDTIDKKNNS